MWSNIGRKCKQLAPLVKSKGSEPLFTMLHANLQSLVNKLDEFTVVLEDTSCDVALVNKHWLKRRRGYLLQPQRLQD